MDETCPLCTGGGRGGDRQPARRLSLSGRVQRPVVRAAPRPHLRAHRRRSHPSHWKPRHWSHWKPRHWSHWSHWSLRKPLGTPLPGSRRTPRGGPTPALRAPQRPVTRPLARQGATRPLVALWVAGTATRLRGRSLGRRGPRGIARRPAGAPLGSQGLGPANGAKGPLEAGRHERCHRGLQPRLRRLLAHGGLQQHDQLRGAQVCYVYLSTQRAAPQRACVRARQPPRAAPARCERRAGCPEGRVRGGRGSGLRDEAQR